MLYHFEATQWIPVPIEEVFRFFGNPDNLPRIMPPASGTKLLQVKLVPPPSRAAAAAGDYPVAGVGSVIVTSFRVIPFLPFRKEWVARIVEFSWNHYFADVQEKGPFKSFHHRHELRPEEQNGKSGTVIRDVIAYEIGCNGLDPVANIFVSRQFRQTFLYRQRALRWILLHA